MKISISNIAWPISEEKYIFSVLRKNSIFNIDIALSKYFSDIMKVDDDDCLSLKNYFSNEEINLVGMQSLLYGMSNYNIFNSEEERIFLLKYLRKTFYIANKLNIRKLVFGSAKNRNKPTKVNFNLDDIIIDFFRDLGNYAKTFNVDVCLEPQPKRYNSNFLTNSKETFEYIKKINHENIKMQLDTGSMIVNQESPDLIKRFKDYYGHIHISEPDLKPLTKVSDMHKLFSKQIKTNLYEFPITIEMLLNKKTNFDEDIKKIISTVRSIYFIQ